MATSVLKRVEQDFLDNFWVLDNPFRFIPLYNGEPKVHVFPRDIVTDQPHPFVINLWPEGQLRTILMREIERVM